MPDVDAVTDPDVLRLYVERITADGDPGRVTSALAAGMLSLRDEALGREPLQDWAQETLIRLGEAARPLRDEGVPCG